MSKSGTSLLIVATVLTACTTAPAYHADAPVPAAWISGAGVPLGDDRWWQRAGDAELDKLVDLAATRNHEVRIAEARLREARADHVTARSLLFPDISANGVAQRGNPGVTSSYKALSLTQGELDASFDLDLFGAAKARSRVARDAANATEADLADITGAVRAEVVSTYISLRQAQQDLHSAQAVAGAAAGIAATRRDQWQKGLISEGDWQAAAADAQAAQAALSRYGEAQTALISGLSVLTGDDGLALQPELTPAGPVPILAATGDLNAPTAVVRHRPDIRAAEDRLAAASAGTRAAQAGLFPDLSLQAFYGSQDSTVHAPIDVWSAAAAVYMPLLNFGRVKGQITAASARESQAYEAYRLSVVSGLADVQTKLAAWRGADQRLALAHDSDTSQARRLAEAHNQYAAGLIPLAAVQAIAIPRERASQALNDAQADASLRTVALLRALGD